MNMWLSTLLFASLLLTSSALTSEECQPLVSPISLADPSVMYGKVNFLAGYTDHDFYRIMLKITESSWINITASPASNAHAVLEQASKMNGTCMKYAFTMKIEGDTVIASHLNMTSELQVLPSCDGCLVFMINTTAKNIKNLLHVMKLTDLELPEEISARSLYILGKGQTLTESDLEHFKKQASCLGFSGEPDFLFNPEKGLCKEDEGIRLPFSK